MQQAVQGAPSRRATPTGAVVVVAGASTMALLGIMSGPVTLTATQVAVGIVALGLVLVSVDAVARHDGPGLPWWALAIRILGIAVLLVPVFIQRGEVGRRYRGMGDQSTPSLGAGVSMESFMRYVDRGFTVLVIVALLWLLVWSGLLVALVRRVRLLLAPRTAPEIPGLAGDPVGDTATRARTGAALRRAAAALDESDDRRRAVIAAYVTLEHHLAEVTARRADETAREYLARALGGAAGPAAPHVAGLLDVFGSARYSDRPVTEADVADARRHLHALVSS